MSRWWWARSYGFRLAVVIGGLYLIGFGLLALYIVTG